MGVRSNESYRAIRRCRRVPYRIVKNNIEVIYANEWNKHAADVYDRRFNDAIDRRDIKSVPSSDIPDHDILVGGFLVKLLASLENAPDSTTYEGRCF